MSGKVDINRGRCDECRRRKKRCVGTGPVCEFCQKKGLACENHNVLKIMHFEPPSKKKQKTISPGLVPDEVQSAAHYEPLDHSANIARVQSLVRNNEEANITKLAPQNQITPTTLVDMIRANLPSSRESKASDSLSFEQTPIIYLPQRKLIISNSTSETPILADESEVKAYSKEDTIPKAFSLLDLLLSSTRVDFIDLSTCHLDEPVSFAEIEKFLKATKFKNTMDLLKEKGYLISSKTSNLRDEPLSAESSPHPSTVSLTKPVFKSMEDVDFKIDLENLKTHFFIQQAAVDDEVENENKKFANLPEFIDPNFADLLFQKYCAISQEVNYSKSLDLSSFPDYLDGSIESKDYVKINSLKICFPLIFGNVTVLKCVLVVSYYRWRNTDPTNELLLKHEQSIKDLHLGIMEELQGRLGHCSSISCDHSLFCVLLLLSTEVIKGLRTPLWRKLLKLMRDMIVLRGGVPRLSENLTGLCMLKLLSVHLSVGGLFSFDANEIDNSENSLSLADFSHIIDAHHQLDFFDNLSFYSNLGLNDMKDVIKTYGQITQLYNLSVVSYDANTRRDSDNAMSSYGSVSLTNLELVLQETESIEQELKQLDEDLFIEDSTILQHQTSQMIFAQKASLLYLYQLVYKQNSTSPKTILAIKELVKDAEDLFDELQNLSFEETQGLVLFIMPFFIVGVDLVSLNTRTWYKDELLKLYENTKKMPLLTCIEILEEVWARNTTGSLHVDWKALCQDIGKDVCLCA